MPRSNTKTGVRFLSLLSICCAMTLALSSPGHVAAQDAGGAAQGAYRALTVTPSRCVYKMGDDVRWADPGWDDSGWATSLPSPVTSLPENAHHWARCRLDLRELARTGPVFVQAEDFAAWELYAGGERIGSFGNLETGRYSMNLVQRFPMPERIAAEGTVVVALRETQRGLPPLRYSPTVDFISAGAEKTLVDETALASMRGFSNRILQFICYGFIGTAGVFLLILSGVDRTRRDLFWLGLFCVGLGELRANELAEVFLVPYPEWACITLLWIGQWSYVSMVCFSFALAGRKTSRVYLASGVIVASSTVLMPFSNILGPQISLAVCWWGYFAPGFQLCLGLLGAFVSTAPIAAFWPVWRIPQQQRRIAAVTFLWATGEIANSSIRVPFLHWLDPTGWVRDYRAIVTTPAIIAMFFLLAQRQRRMSLERSELQAEMHAAQEMQRLLVPDRLDLEPWIAVDVAYLPAKEVGGDFYFCRRVAAGQLIVIGDVSGKGMRAAMMASTLVGALRNEESADPTRILARLNAVVLSAHFGGFVTCLCALFGSDGTLRFANAGHIPPYLKGRELEAVAGLPLGIDADGEYEEASFALHHQTVTLLSDGVLEARNTKGEMLGFDRMASLTSQPAAGIADAAQRWGQEDDITVLTLNFAAAGAFLKS